MIFEHRTLDNNYNLYSLLNIKKYMRVKTTKQVSGLFSIFFAIIFFFLKKRRNFACLFVKGVSPQDLKTFRIGLLDYPCRAIFSERSWV